MVACWPLAAARFSEWKLLDFGGDIGRTDGCLLNGKTLPDSTDFSVELLVDFDFASSPL